MTLSASTQIGTYAVLNTKTGTISNGEDFATACLQAELLNLTVNGNQFRVVRADMTDIGLD